jgi:type IV pilus assembly protein PilE
MATKRHNGFTLIELMIATAIVALLAALAYPSYTRYIVRSNRTSAQAQMMDIANREQQYLLANRTYATKAQIESGGYSLPPNLQPRYDYDIVVDSTAAPLYTITFTAKGPQLSDGPLTLDSSGVKLPAGKW